MPARSDPRTDFGWLIRKYEVWLLLTCCTAPSNTKPVSAYDNDSRMTGRLSILAIVVILVFAVRAVQGASAGEAASATALAGVLAAGLAAVFEFAARGYWNDDLRDSVQISFYTFLALVMALYVVVDTAFGTAFAQSPGGRYFLGAAFASAGAFVILLAKAFAFDHAPGGLRAVGQIALMIAFCGFLIWIIAAAPNSIFEWAVEQISRLVEK